MDAGELVPDAVMVGMIRERLVGRDGPLPAGRLPALGPAGRRARRACSPTSAFHSTRSSPSGVSRDELVRRLAGRWICRRCGRSFHEVFNPYLARRARRAVGTCDLYQREDDKPETVANRLSVYDEQTAPLIDYYRSRGLLREVDGERTPDEVYAQIIAHIPAPE